MDWKRPLLIGVGWGIGTAVALAAIVGTFIWYEARPKPPVPPKPWNTAAIKAQYDYADTEGDKNNIVIYYTLENFTDFDYRLEDAHDVTMSAQLGKQNSLSPFSEMEKIDYPVFVPAKKRVRFKIHISYPYPVREKANDTLEEGREYRAGLDKYMTDELANLDGFDLLDESNRYEIIFPSGWKHPKNP